MSVRKLDKHCLAYRIGDSEGRYPIFSGEGAKRVEGRWHNRGQGAIYTSEHYSTAMLERLAHFNGVMPSGQHYLEIDIPAGVSYEVVTKDSLTEWTDAQIARAFGSRWIIERRSALLFVPSFVARMERNIIINPAHQDFPRINTGLEEPIWWDERLFSN